jgi:hypothetical protein
MTMNDWHNETCCAKRCAKQPVIKINGFLLCETHHNRATDESTTIAEALEKMTRNDAKQESDFVGKKKRGALCEICGLPKNAIIIEPKRR